ncbi:hypothetical protein J6590_089791, partial [Homalodisca vitripennis]
GHNTFTSGRINERCPANITNTFWTRLKVIFCLNEREKSELNKGAPGLSRYPPPAPSRPGCTLR